MNQIVSRKDGAAAAGVRRIRVPTSGATTSGIELVDTGGVMSVRQSDEAIANAVYGHIQAVRALGRTEISASEIASALSLPLDVVVKALATLQDKGVKLPA